MVLETSTTPVSRYDAAWYYRHPARAEQRQVLDFVDKHPDTKVIAADCPTGVGKSAICATLGNAQGGTIITTQKVLQAQYARDWPQIPILKGANAYSCHEQIEDQAPLYERGCDIGGRRHKCESCPYRMAKFRFKMDRLGVTNYSYVLSTMLSPGDPTTSPLQKKHWLLLDEAHNSEEALIRAAEVRILASFCVEVLGVPYEEPRKPKEAQAIAQKMAGIARQRLVDVQRNSEKIRVGGGKISGRAAKLERDLTTLITSVSVMSNDKMDTEWVFGEVKEGLGHIGFTLRPLFANGLFSHFLMPLADQFFLTSATILDGDMMRKWLGIQPADFEFLSVESPFPVDNRPVWYQPICSMSHANLEANVGKMARAINRRIEAHAGEKGIIHTSSFRLSYMLKEHLRNPRILMHDSRDREQVLARHLNSREPTVLMSPSMFEGVDLKDDLSRFTIIPKVPYPNLGDPWIRRRMELDGKWYGWQTMKALIQGVGRSIRSEVDHADAYILDRQFGDMFWPQHRSLAPRWFRRSVVFPD